MAQFKEAEARMFTSIYICRKCESKTRIPIRKVLSGKAVCRNCGAKQVRPVRRRSKN